jgi:hypothetical protein
MSAAEPGPWSTWPATGTASPANASVVSRSTKPPNSKSILQRAATGRCLRTIIGAKPEDWGQWTRATRAALSFSVGAPRDLVVALSIGALLSATAPKQSVWIEANHCRVRGVDFDLAHGSWPQTISGTIPAGCINADGTVILRVNTDRVRSPKEIEINDDERKLGVAVERVHATNLR